MRTLIVLLMALGWAAGPLCGQEQVLCPPPDPSSGVGSIVGQVIDAETQVPLGFVQLHLRIQGVELPLEARSNTLGWFQFCSVPSGIVTLTGTLSQLGAHMGPISLEPGQSLSLSLSLAPPSDGRNTGSLTGIVIDHDSGEPIEGASVLLPDVGQTAISNVFGRFTFPSLTPGNMALEVTRLGYGNASGMVDVEFGRTVHTQVELSTEPIAMAPITVTAVRRRIELPGLEAFERRFNSGWGRFVLEDEIQRRSPTKLTDVLHETGVEVGNNGQTIYMRRTGCGPMVYIDDVKVTHMSRSKSLMGAGSSTNLTNQRPIQKQGAKPSVLARLLGNESPEAEAADALNNMVNPMDVIAVEVYRGPAETPGQYLDSNAQCGVILIWTRRGNIGRR